MAHPIAPSTLKTIPDGLPATLRPLGALPAEEAHDRFWNIVAIVVVALIFLVILGGWSYKKVSDSLSEIRASNLNALLDANARLLQVWIDEKKRDAERWASAPEVQHDAATLVRMAERGVPYSQVCASASARSLLAEIAPFATLEEVVAFNLIARDGTVIASQHAANCGARVRDEEFMKRIAPVFAGRSVLVRPWLESDRLGPGAAASMISQPLVWMETPVRDQGGEVIAALGFGRVAAERFGKLLASTASESSREVYTFGARGLMLSASRYEPELREAGVLGAGESTLLRLSVRDTRLGKAAIDGLRVGGLEGASGLLLEPYRNYRGAEVIGAWRWLPEKEMAIAVEVEAVEAYAPLHYLQVAFGVLFGFLAASLIAASGMSLWAARMRLRERGRLGQYAIEREIGEGGLSHVYLARHSHLKRPTAVKVLKAHLASDEVVTRFEREVQLCSQLNHPNTIEIYDYGRTRDGRFYYAMEYLHGTSLEDLVRKEGAMPVSRAVYALRQACWSLREAHARGLVHRDVKPQNLMLCMRGEQYDVLKVLDFGLVKEMSNPDTRDITQFAKVLGTPLYMAPERLRNPGDADARVDIYALGAVMHFLVTARHVFEAQTDHDLVYQVLNAPAPSMAEHGATDVPPVLEALVARCLAKDREARPGTIEEVDAVLREVGRQRPWREEEARAWWARFPKDAAPLEKR